MQRRGNFRGWTSGRGAKLHQQPKRTVEGRKWTLLLQEECREQTSKPGSANSGRNHLILEKTAERKATHLSGKRRAGRRVALGR